MVVFGQVSGSTEWMVVHMQHIKMCFHVVLLRKTTTCSDGAAHRDGRKGFKQEMVQESVKVEKITPKTKKSNIKSRDKLQETAFNIQFFLS